MLEKFLEALDKIFNQLGRIADALEEIQYHGVAQDPDRQKTTALPVALGEAPAALEPPKRKGRGPAKEKTEVAPAAPVTPAAGEVVYGEIDVRGFLGQVLNVKGYEYAEKMLEPYGVKKVKDLKPEQYPSVIADCRKALL